MYIKNNINDYRKEAIYDYYCRIVSKPKKYESITRKKMVDEVYKLYQDPHIILDLCTVREIKYLEYNKS